MIEFFIVMALLFAAYHFLPSTWLAKSVVIQPQASSTLSEAKILVPEDSVLRRHYLTQLRYEIEQELSPRPTDFNLQRHYDSLLASKLESRLAGQLQA